MSIPNFPNIDTEEFADVYETGAELMSDLDQQHAEQPAVGVVETPKLAEPSNSATTPKTSRQPVAKEQLVQAPKRASRQMPAKFGGEPEVKQARTQRIATVKGRMAANGVDVEAPSSIPFEHQYYLFVLERCLKFHMCDECVKFYIDDKEKVKHMGGGYRMLTILLCPNCVSGNNEVKRAFKMAFGKKKEGSGQ